MQGEIAKGDDVLVDARAYELSRTESEIGTSQERVVLEIGEARRVVSDSGSGFTPEWLGASVGVPYEASPGV